MPGVSRAHRAEAKYNVTLDFPNLGLHSAAASGDIGLVKYALEHGQPINSASEGVLPLHVACSGGNDLVVRFLIEKGADVNAPRLPRRYSTSDKNKEAPLPVVLTSGSTPLHFACASGHTNIVMTLLLHGAHPDRPDKHGTTPEMLARQNGWVACADVLRQWSHNKDKDLRDREAIWSPQAFPQAGDDASSAKEHINCFLQECRECHAKKRLRVKQSIDNAIHMLKPVLHSNSGGISSPPTASNPLPTESLPPSPTKISLDSPLHHTFDSDESHRRPSITTGLEVPRHSTSSSRRPSNFSISSASSPRRPRSAGTDAEQTSTPPSNKVKGKLSLLNIFKKSNTDVYAIPDNLSSYTSSTSAFTSGSPSPAPEAHSATLPPPFSRSTDALSLNSTEASPLASDRLRHRLFSESNKHSPIRPQAVELHHALSRESLHGQFAASGVNVDTQPQPAKSPSVRPGILRAHGRSSSGQSSSHHAHHESTKSASFVQPSTQSIRALRFDSSSTTSSISIPKNPERHNHSRHHSHSRSRSPSRALHAASSAASLRLPSPGSLFVPRRDGETNHLTTSPEIMSTVSASSKVGDEEEEEEYGHIIHPHVGLSISTHPPVEPSESSSSSEVPSPDGPMSQVFECPFSINCPPPGEIIRSSQLGVDVVDGRGRGDSLSSDSTNASFNASSSSSGSGMVSTPAVSHMNLSGVIVSSPKSIPPELPAHINSCNPESNPVHIVHLPSPIDDVETPLASKRPRIPPDIDIRTISSHAQAEALVQHAQQCILEMEVRPPLEDNHVARPCGDSRTPLSARLAAYGESLEIERKFKEEEERRLSPLKTSPPTISINSPTSDIRDESDKVLKTSHSARALDRKFSLEERYRVGASPANRRIRRPHTAGSIPNSDPESSGRITRSDTSKTATDTTRDVDDGSSKASRTLVDSTSATPPSSSSYLKVRSSDIGTSSDRPMLVRSRTPDPESDVSGYIGVPLSRYSSTPAHDSLCDVLPKKVLSKQEREVARANKLVKMGFASGGETWQQSPRPAQTPPKHRFGGIRTFVQTLTGGG
ncbi:hypothetical protein C8Q75DRAFT_893756 [Abortiporus biennis]|nr:hypothetical protein C8Q75DRAFT_893756 [Abortiporus biennis]